LGFLAGWGGIRARKVGSTWSPVASLWASAASLKTMSAIEIDAIRKPLARIHSIPCRLGCLIFADLRWQ